MSEPALQLSATSVKYAPWEQFKRPFVRDLAYVLACPDVLTKWLDFAPNQNTSPISVHSASFWQAQFDTYYERLEALDNTTAYQELTRYLLTRPSPRRLGFHFEGLLSFWLADGYAQSLHPYEMLASNVQLYQGKQTVGELDLILYNHKDQLTEHWELAIKFFMGSAPFAPENWVGINSNDNLERKITHMQTKQFQAVWVDTADHGRVEIDKRYGVIKGRFFLPQLLKPSALFTRPNWLTPNFPLHEWYDNHDKVNLAMLDVTSLRQAHYVEWFTKRDIYDKRHMQTVWSETELPATGLYFEGNRPIVIYPEQRDRAEDKF